MPELEDGIVARTINRRISRRITRYMVRSHPEITPNQVSVFCFGLGLLGALFYPLRHPFLAGVLLQTASVLDGCDGEIARALKKESPFGGFLDSVLDRYIDIAAIVGITWLLFLHTPPTYFLHLVVLSALAMAGALMVSYTAAIGREQSLVFARTVQSRDVRLFAIFLTSILAQFILEALFVALLYLAIVCNIAIIIRLNIAKKSLRT